MAELPKDEPLVCLAVLFIVALRFQEEEVLEERGMSDSRANDVAK